MKKLLLKIILLVGSFIFIMKAVKAQSIGVNTTSGTLSYLASQHRFSCMIHWIDQDKIQSYHRPIQMNQQEKDFMLLKRTIDTMVLSVAMMSPLLILVGIAIKCHLLPLGKQN